MPERRGTRACIQRVCRKFFGSKFEIVLGKLYTLEGDGNAFAHDFHSQVLNTALTFSATTDLFPTTAYGGGLIFLPWEGAIFTADVVDPSGTATDNDISKAFSDGVLVSGESA